MLFIEWEKHQGKNLPRQAILARNKGKILNSTLYSIDEKIKQQQVTMKLLRLLYAATIASAFMLQQ